MPIRYRPFIPIAIAAIGTLPKPLTTRCIVINMRPKGDRVKKEVDPRLPEYQTVVGYARQCITRWANNCQPYLSRTPDMAGLNNRYAELWRPLVSIGDALNRGDKVRHVAKAMMPEHGPGEHMLVLTHIFQIFNDTRTDRMERETVLNKLHERDEWNSWGRPHPLTQNEFSRLLRECRVPPAHTIYAKGGRADRGPAQWGWYRKDFEEAWAAYGIR